jgi:hypothetical protein
MPGKILKLLTLIVYMLLIILLYGGKGKGIGD